MPGQIKRSKVIKKLRERGFDYPESLHKERNRFDRKYDGWYVETRNGSKFLGRTLKRAALLLRAEQLREEARAIQSAL